MSALLYLDPTLLSLSLTPPTRSILDLLVSHFTWHKRKYCKNKYSKLHDTREKSSSVAQLRTRWCLVRGTCFGASCPSHGSRPYLYLQRWWRQHTLDAYFEREQRSTILLNLNKELVEDLGASTYNEEIKYITREVRKRVVGAAFGKMDKDKETE